MPLYNKQNLRFSYNWDTPEEECAAIEGFPENRELNRHDGNEVLYFINRYMEQNNYRLLTTFQKLEDLIRIHLLVSIKSHSGIRDWLNENHVF